MTVFANDRTGQAVRGNVRANRYRELQMDESARTIDNYFGYRRLVRASFAPAESMMAGALTGSPPTVSLVLRVLELSEVRATSTSTFL
jgi:hypothetical protein